MSLAGLMVRDVTLVRAGVATSRYMDQGKDWATATRAVVKGWVSQRSRSENLDSREAQIVEHVLFLAAGSDVTGVDRVEVDSVVYEVVGPPNRAWTPRGEHHVELNLRAAAG